jgi:hypothetical protein
VIFTWVYAAVCVTIALWLLVPTVVRERRGRRAVELLPPPPRQRPRRKSIVVDGYTHPSDTVRAVFEDKQE